MALAFYNSLSREKEKFKPINENEVTLYTCGPTVYDYAHIGNFRAYIFEDLLHRVLKLEIRYWVRIKERSVWTSHFPYFTENL